MAAKKPKKKRRNAAQTSLPFQSRAMVLHRGGPGTMPGRKKAAKKRPAAKKVASHKPRSSSTMAARKKKRPKAVYKVTKKGGRRRRTVAIHGPVFKGSARGRKRRVKRVNPHARRRRHVRKNPAGFMGAALAVVAGFATGVVLRVGAHMAAPTSTNAGRIAGGLGVVAGLAMAAKMANPLYGIAVAVASADAALQNDAVFKAESLTSPAATQQALGAVFYQNMRGLSPARNVPEFAEMGALPDFARMGAIVSNNMAGFASGQIASMRVHNPFER